MLTAFLDKVKEQNFNLYGIVVLKDGIQVASQRLRSDDRINLYSASKSFVSVAIGMAIDEGLLTPDDKIAPLFEDKIPADADPRYYDITVRNLLTMSSGHKKGMFFSSNDHTYTESDYVSFFYRQELEYDPGEQFVYNNGCTYMLSAVLQKKAGITLKQYLIPRLFTPLGIGNPQWFECPLGVTYGATGLFLRTDELAKFCQMLLDEGCYNGVQLVSSNYIKQASKVQIMSHYVESESLSYGFHFWQNSYENSYRADGMYGQIGMVFPSKNAVVAFTAHEESGVQDMMRAVYSEILPYL